ncbi:YceD family protein [Qipengyuania nanhaisediminis]|uniref:YceD family protein n=1 Tax=Qipengyuania nanhaisediminis TaxID=604088 RepID=UPI0038B35868
MSPENCELSRRYKTKGLPAEPVVIEADAGERAALAGRFGLPGIDSLRAVIALEPRGSAIRATGTLDAAIRQACAVSGEEFPANIAEVIDLRFIEEGDTAAAPTVDEDGEIEIELDADDCDEIEFSGESFDLGEAVAQTLGLAIDPYAEGPGADEARRKAGIAAEGEQDGPLAAMLKDFKPD